VNTHNIALDGLVVLFILLIIFDGWYQRRKGNREVQL
jgi:hypothetical protein